MTDGYQVVVEEIRRASAAAADAAEIASRIDLATAIEPVGQALSGSRTARSVSTVKHFWNQEVAGWTAAANRYAEDLAASADVYGAVEQQTADVFRTEGW